jgi:hypothetical protein
VFCEFLSAEQALRARCDRRPSQCWEVDTL